MSAMPWPVESHCDRWRLKSRPKSVVERDLLATLDPLGRRGRIWIAGLAVVVGVAVVAWIYQLVHGLRVTDMGNVVSWGTYMTNFVFFIGISHAGTLISAILRVTDAGWRRPITRMAEAITCIALLVGASMVVIDMGRPDRVLNLLLHGRFQSPILWDLVSVTTYLTGSFFYLYVAMIPDMPILAKFARERGRSPRLVRFYEILSLGYRESPEHRRLLARALGAMAVIIIPVAISVHTVVSWVFGMTLRPGWHSTIFGPYFVIGAIFSGTAAIITAMVIFRKAYHLERYLLPEHFHKLAKILLALSLLYAYFTLSEYLTTWYGGAEIDVRLLALLAGNGTVGAVVLALGALRAVRSDRAAALPEQAFAGLDHDGVDPDQHRHVDQALPDHRADARDAVHPRAGRRESRRTTSRAWSRCTITVGRIRRLRAAVHPLLAASSRSCRSGRPPRTSRRSNTRRRRRTSGCLGRAMPAALPALLVAAGLSALAPWTAARAQAPASPPSHRGSSSSARPRTSRKCSWPPSRRTAVRSPARSWRSRWSARSE